MPANPVMPTRSDSSTPRVDARGAIASLLAIRVALKVDPATAIGG